MDRILVIDDNTDILENICELLDNNGYKTYDASNISDGEKLVFEISPDLILCDIRMETESDGFKLLEKLYKRKLVPQIPFIFLTVLGETENIVKGFNMGAQDYIIKPFEKAILLARIKVHLDLRRARLDLEKRNHQLDVAKTNLENANKELKLKIHELSKKTITHEKLATLLKKYLISILNLVLRKTRWK
ncbi:MAG: response regulator [Chloroflexia bacterium]|nr:response regulator [Chloroflexia bacterium]